MILERKAAVHVSSLEIKQKQRKRHKYADVGFFPSDIN